MDIRKIVSTVQVRRAEPRGSLPSLCVLGRFVFWFAAATLASAATPPTDPASRLAVATEPTEGQWRLESRLSLMGTYDDNIFIQPRGAEGDFLIRAAPSVAYGIGNFLSEFAPFPEIPHFFVRLGERELPHNNFAFVSYTPEAVWFASNHDQDAINHDVRLVGRTGREQWSLQGNLQFRSVDDANIDVGRRVRQTYYRGGASGTYELSGRTKAGLSMQAEHAAFTGGFSSDDARATGSIDYQIAPKTEIGLGLTLGYLSVAHGEDQTFTRPLLRLRYHPTEKLTFGGEAGEEFRHFDGEVGDRSRFVFGLSGEYLPRDGLSISVSGRRDTIGSAQYPGENIVTTTYEGGARQRFLRRHYLALSGGFVRNDYENNRTSSVISRRDNYVFGRFGVSRDVTTRGSADLSYEYRSNDSSAANFGFEENVVSLALSFLF
jgi:hypothetical protein